MPDLHVEPSRGTGARMSLAELLELARTSTTTTLPVAGRAHGIGSNLAYELYAQGEFPCRVLRLGRKLVVPTADLLASLGIAMPLSDAG